MSIHTYTPCTSLLTPPIFKSSYLIPCHSLLFIDHILHYKPHVLSTLGGDTQGSVSGAGGTRLVTSQKRTILYLQLSSHCE